MGVIQSVYMLIVPVFAVWSRVADPDPTFEEKPDPEPDKTPEEQPGFGSHLIYEITFYFFTTSKWI